jgi:hypothetical protein
VITLCIRYRIDHHKRADFEAYARSLAAPIRRSGGELVGYFLPTLLAGSTTCAIGLIGFADLASYERYRAALAADPEGQEALRRVESARCILEEERSFLRCVDG